jgi:HlyD family secretion protein
MSERNNKRRRMRLAIAAVAVVLAGSAGFWGLRQAHSAPSIPTAVVRRGAFVGWLDLRGQIAARQSVVIAAPYRIDNMRILKLLPNGTRVEKGETLVEFDSTQLRRDLAQNRVDLKSAQADVEQQRAQGRLTEEKDLTDVMKARYDVQSAELDASKAEIVSEIEGAEAKLKLADARQKLVAAEAKLKADHASDAAAVKGKEDARDKALYQMQQNERSLSQLILHAPTDGMFTLLNTHWTSPTSGPQPFRSGDQIWPGAAIAELPDLSTLEVTARVDEDERGRLQVGQKADLRFTAIPDRAFTGRVKSISTLASVDFSEGWPPPRNFTVRLALDQSDERLRPTMSGTVRVAVDRVASGILIPSEALFPKNGETVAYVLDGSKFEARKIVVAQQSGGQVLVAKGLQVGERVALQNPEPSP